ncbi:MAG: DUF4390 domain-containing protein [bacterium]
MKLCASFLIICALCAFLLVPESSFAAKATIKEIDLTVSGEVFYVNALMQEAFTKKIKEAVSTGAPAEFLFYLQIRNRIAPFINLTVARTTVRYTVSYDSLKKQYQGTQSVQGKDTKTLVTSNWDEIVKWVSELRRVEFPLSLIKKEKANHIRIKAEMKCLKLPFPLNQLFNLISLWNFETPWKVYWLEDELKEELMTD